MALASSTKTVHRHLRTKELILNLQASGNYVPGGDTLNLPANTVPVGISDGNIGFPGTITDYEVKSCPAGYTAKLIPGSNLTNWKLKVFQTGAAVNSALAELPAAAYPVGVTGDVFVISLIGPKLRI